MKLSQYKEKKKSKKLIIVVVAIVFLIGGIILEKTFANFKVQKSFKVMEGNFIYEGSGDVIFSFYNNGKNVSTIPKKEEGVSFLSSKCSNNASVKWYDNLWAPIVTNLTEQGTKCELYFGKSAVEYLIDLQKEKPSELAYDGKESLGEYGTDDNNLRFIGSNPNNYVEFNNDYIYRGYSSSSSSSYTDYNSYEECTSASSYNYNCEKVRPAWRIIGVMNNITDEYGSIGSHLKIIRDSIGAYSWDSSNGYGSSVNSGYGVNEWSQADIQKVLNENYYNKKAGGTCYEGSDNKEKSCPLWENIGLNDEARKMISKVKWNTGAVMYWIGNTSQIYDKERGLADGLCEGVDYNNQYVPYNDGIARTTEWLGYVGLAYLSDYGYSLGGEKRNTCVSIYFEVESMKGHNECANLWLLNLGQGYRLTMNPICSTLNQSTLTYKKSSAVAYVIMNNYSDGSKSIGASLTSAATGGQVQPTVYLNSNVKIEEDTSEDYGSVTNPFRFTVD